MQDKIEKRMALENPETCATVLISILLQDFGEIFLSWDPTTIWLEARDEYGAEMPAPSTDKLAAMQVVMTSDVFFRRFDAFSGICNTLASGAPFFSAFDPVTTEEASWAITEISLNRELLPFSYPIKKYLRIILKADGYNENEYPTPFDEVFGIKPASRDIRKSLASLENSDNVEHFINENLADLVAQFNKIPSLNTLDDIILHRNLDEYVTGILAK